MGKKTGRKNTAPRRASLRTKKKRRLAAALGGGVLAVAALLFLVFHFHTADTKIYREKIELLRASALTQQTYDKIGTNPAGETAGQAVFISICNTQQRARVFTGTGKDLDSAWEAASKQAQKFLSGSNYDPKWVKADVVYTSRVLDTKELSEEVRSARNEFYRYGIAFDGDYQTALLEAELNGAKIYDYENDQVDFEYLNRYLTKASRPTLEKLPEAYTAFQCLGWFCDEDNAVCQLYGDGLEYGRRAIDVIDDQYVKRLLVNAGGFLVDQVNADGSFIYGFYPRFDKPIENYNILRHASTIWSLICQYRVTGDASLITVIESSIDYMLESVVYKDDSAYLYESKDDEIKLGGCGVSIIALTEYMDVFQNDKYKDVCKKLGNGILSMMDQETGKYYHVLNGDFSKKEEYRTVYYDGEATFALSRLYGLTGEQRWLDAAKAAVEHFINADYTVHRDHWVAYSMNEITKYVDDPRYYAFALRNAQENLETIYRQDTTYHTYLELLMVTFDTYDRMIQRNIHVDYLDQFHLDEFLKTIYARADRMLNGYFYPEYAMYMANPQRILDTFMVRHDGYRVRIDDVQHNIGGYYRYYENYQKMVAYGLLEYRDQPA